MLTRSRELPGRAAEIDRLRAHVAALGRRGRAVAVVGEPGAGKSRLVAELLHGLAPEDLALTGRAGELERDVPFGPFVDALDLHVGALGEARLRALHAEQRARLGAIFPALATSRDDERSRGERHRSHQAVRALLELLAAGRRCVLVLDDVHWADEASVELIAHLLRRAPAARVLMVLALDPAHASPRLKAALDAAACDTIQLRALSHADRRVETDLAGLAPGRARPRRGGAHRRRRATGRRGASRRALGGGRRGRGCRAAGPRRARDERAGARQRGALVRRRAAAPASRMR